MTGILIDYVAITNVTLKDGKVIQRFQPFPSDLDIDYDRLIQGRLIKTLEDFQRQGAPCLTCGE